ncbi:MAG TPA: FAD-binding oxidoreductase [Actinomycetes bacterium]|nr:FAD-binding oxidoreductase [Actinomycetes bacterium]
MTATSEQGIHDALAAEIRGTVIAPGGSAPEQELYDEARKVYNGMIDRKPAIIVQCADAADVISAIRIARENGLAISVRGGGHHANGFGVWDDALVIDLRNMKGVDVNPKERTVRVQGGAVWGDVDHATHAFGLAVPTGIISTTGVGGLTLGGGVGNLARQCGLTIDNLISADVVLADGTQVTASEKSNPDLFWALRGGGGNFGVVTSFVFRCHEVSTIVGGPVLYDIKDTGEVLRWYRETQPNLPPDLSGWFALLTVPPGPPFPEELWMRKACAVVWCYGGDPSRADEVLAPVRAFGKPILDGVAEMPLPVLQSAFDALYPAGLQWYWRADFFREISDDAIAVHEKFGAELPTPGSTMHLYAIDGEVNKVGATDTAFAYRDVGWAGVIVGVDPDPKNAKLLKDWTIAYWEALHPTSAGGAYVNMMMDEGEDRIKAAYGPNYERLSKVKAKYDPGNIFHVNQNIKPAK